jgi:predicted DNA-binding protein
MRHVVYRVVADHYGPHKERMMGTNPQIGIRLPAELLERLDVLAARRSPAGVKLSRTDAIRMAIVAGLDKLDAEDAVVLAKKPPAKKGR